MQQSEPTQSALYSNSAAQQIAVPERSYTLSVESQRLSPSGELGCYDQLTFRSSRTATDDLRDASATPAVGCPFAKRLEEKGCRANAAALRYRTPIRREKDSRIFTPLAQFRS